MAPWISYPFTLFAYPSVPTQVVCVVWGVRIVGRVLKTLQTVEKQPAEFCKAFCLSRENVCDFSANAWELSGRYGALMGHLICCLRTEVQYYGEDLYLALPVFRLRYFVKVYDENHWHPASVPFLQFSAGLSWCMLFMETPGNGFLIVKKKKKRICYKSWVLKKSWAFLNIPIFELF